MKLEKEDFGQVLAADNGELRITKGKLLRDHLDCKGSTRQWVFLATQLLSQTTAKAMTFLFGQSKAKKAQIIQTLNNWFDVMNASCMLSPKKLACGYGIHLEVQEHVLDKMEKLFKSPVTCRRMTRLPFENGILLSSKSTKSLFAYHKDMYSSFSFLLTSHLNQDLLGNKFSRIRGIGGDNKHPGCVDVINRIHSLTFGWNPDVFVQKCPVQLMPDHQRQFFPAEIIQVIDSSDVLPVSEDESGLPVREIIIDPNKDAARKNCNDEGATNEYSDSSDEDAANENCELYDRDATSIQMILEMNV